MGVSRHFRSFRGQFQANGLDEERLARQVEAIHELNQSDFRVHLFAGCEVDVLSGGNWILRMRCWSGLCGSLGARGRPG